MCQPDGIERLKMCLAAGATIIQLISLRLAVLWRNFTHFGLCSREVLRWINLKKYQEY